MNNGRRNFLRGFVPIVAGLAGCGTPPDEENIIIINFSSDEITAIIDVVRIADAKQLLNDTFTLAVHHPDDPSSKVYPDHVHEERVRVRLTVKNGPAASHEYVDKSKSETEDVYINIHDDHIEFKPTSSTL